LCEKGWDNREGLCQAMSPKMKTITAPALTASVNSWLRPPAEGSIIMAARVPYRLRMPKERQEGGQVRSDVWGTRGSKIRGPTTFKGWSKQGTQPSAQPSHHVEEACRGRHPAARYARARLALADLSLLRRQGGVRIAAIDPFWGILGGVAHF
jgi:hypothetical protein